MSAIFGTTKYQLELNENWKAYRNDEKQPVNVSVPGHIQYDMFKAELLPDPFIGENCEEWQPACEDDYTYSLNFDISASLIDNENVELVFEGIDTISEISLNGKILGKTDNMFKTWRSKRQEKPLWKFAKNIKIVRNCSNITLPSFLGSSR